MNRTRAVAHERSSRQPMGGSRHTASHTEAHAPSPPALLVARPGGAASSFSRRFGDRSPVLAFICTVLAGYVLLAAVAVGVGFLLVDVLLPVHAIGHSDEAVNDWLARQRTPTLSDASYVGSSIGDIPFIPGLVIVFGLAAAIRRRWRAGALIVGAILVEVATYRLTSLIVHRRRPDVPRMDHLPVNQSFPSGHVAASVVVYVGLALLLASHVHSRGRLVAIWAIAIALPLLVALSRMYRGMHHPIDATAGALIGLASLAIAIFATRVAGDVARRRDAARARGARA
jgi:membrane-associated phospholipid phosphatase